MNYQKVYDAICNRARNRETPSGYVEKHHVLPVSLGGDDKPLCVEFLNGDMVFTEVGAEEFARQQGIPTGTMSFCLSTGYGVVKHKIKKAWRP